ncbi:phosphoribosyltransferase-like protein [Flavobacterium sedimenticola]|uniref:PRTase-CE domain-containing protein n=1 Tax=Flavobacterium sedimenticola TaxID=3043286 RepID=A0ABT6XS71_9FLAO|nr:hypothetical protein [Flavobacterium sedimenticola]MDI9257951.1 hypothetical protein [Flavobacterium sedimenticola]
MSDQEKEDFVKYALQKVHFYIESKFWSKLDNDTLHKWLNNFKSTDEKYCAAKLLDRLVYYSEEDIVRLLEFGFNEIVLKRYVLELELENDFKVSNYDILKFRNKFYSKSVIVPLLSNKNPSESSLAMTRYLTNDLGFPESRILDITNLSGEVLKNANNLIIIDDFIGSGTQIFDFWNVTKMKIDDTEYTINKIKSLYPKLEIEYLCLVCTEEGYLNFHTKNTAVGLKITYCEKLANKFRVFGSTSVYFDRDEVQENKSIIEGLCDKNGISLLGYQGLDYAIAFHHDIPDSSLPLFYKQTENWNPLFRNKKTNTQTDVIV